MHEVVVIVVVEVAWERGGGVANVIIAAVVSSLTLSW